jgi:SpoVK/Ycf46/Vps4 family AAA+-type ATPase
MIQPLAWDDLVLDASVVRLVREDFRLFLEREEWYKRHRLPFRRGYLFYGSPGNGKSSAIRAMLSAPGVSGFMLNPFRTFDDDILGAMFKEASESTPAIIVLEDLDRCYPLDKELEPESRIPLQQLLNHLDGVGSQDGVVVAATANDPSILDSAILRRPGRFDRVVGFKNPPAELRQRYFRHMCAVRPHDGELLIRPTARGIHLGWPDCSGRRRRNQCFSARQSDMHAYRDDGCSRSEVEFAGRVSRDCIESAVRRLVRRRAAISENAGVRAERLRHAVGT